jgi:microcystin-dependent protein
VAEPFLSEIRVFSFNFAPRGWAMANGQLLPINQNQALFSLLGITYGGDGRVNFGLPNLQGRVPVHEGAGFVLGQNAGDSAVTLTTPTMPMHLHPLQGNSVPGALVTPTAGSQLAQSTSSSYGKLGDPGQPMMVPMALDTLASAGGGQPHENRQPYLALNFCVALQGIFPSPN